MVGHRTGWLEDNPTMSVHARNELSGAGLETQEYDGIDLDTVFGTLKNSRRRAAIAVVLEEGNVAFSRLVDRVAEIEYGLSCEEISSDERHRVYVALQQTHIDALEESGAITKDRKRITPGPNADVFREFLAKINDESLMSRVRQTVGL